MAELFKAELAKQGRWRAHTAPRQEPKTGQTLCVGTHLRMLWQEVQFRSPWFGE